MSTTGLLGLTSFEKIGGHCIFWGASNCSNLLGQWLQELMLRAARQTSLALIVLKPFLFQYPLAGPSATRLATYLRLNVPRLLVDLLELVLYIHGLVEEGLGKV